MKKVTKNVRLVGVLSDTRVSLQKEDLVPIERCSWARLQKIVNRLNLEERVEHWSAMRGPAVGRMFDD